jgi:hypothetical protein
MLSLHTGNVNASALAGVGLQKLNAVYGAGINVDADINFECVGDSQISLTDLQKENKAYYIKPSSNYVVDNTFYAKNAELYNVCKFNGNVKIVSGSDGSNGGGALSAVISNDLIRIGSESSGKIILNETNSKKLYLNSRTVEVDGDVWNENYFIYLGFAWGNLRRVNAIIDFNVMLGSSMNNVNHSTHEVRTYGSTARQCRFIIGSDYAPIISSNGVIFEQSEIIDSDFAIYGCIVAFSHTKVRRCGFYGKTNFKQSETYGGASNAAPGASAMIWINSVLLYNDSEITGSQFCRCQVIPINDSRNQMRNIHFDGNWVFDDGHGTYPTYADKDNNNKNVYAIIRMFQGINFDFDGMGNGSNLRGGVNSIPMDGVSVIKMENVTFKGNLRSDAGGFSMFSPSSKAVKNRALQGHIEITGDYNYNFLGKQGTYTVVAATETFPPYESAIDYWYNGNPWDSGAEGFIKSLCMFVPGDPVKYTNKDGQFFSVDPFGYHTNSYNSTFSLILETWDRLPDAGVFPILNLLKSQGNRLAYSIRLSGTSNDYFGTNNPNNVFPAVDSVLSNLTQSSKLIVDVLAAYWGTSEDPQYYFTWEQISNPNNFLAVFTSNDTLILIGTSAGGTLSAWLFPESYSESFWGWNYYLPIPKTTGVTAYTWTDEETGETGTTVVSLCCLLCCNCDVKLYRIRE